MTVRELYEKLSARIPEELSESWDNDGIMCCSDDYREVERVLVALDVTDEVVDYAIDNGFDVIISHHPLVFKPISSVNPDNHISRKLIKLIKADVSVLSFHTRADKVRGGVNDCLARLLQLADVEPFGEDGLGRIGSLPEERELENFAEDVKMLLGADTVRFADAYNAVKRVALVGGDGKSYVDEARDIGADTYISGRIGYNVMEEAEELGINLIEAGHYYTELPITTFFSTLVSSIDGNAYIEIADSNMIKSV